MNRRDILLTTAAATLTASTAATAGGLTGNSPSDEPRPTSPVIEAARRWRAHYDWINATELTEDTTNAEVVRLGEIEDEVLALVPRDDRDLLVQLMLLTVMWEGCCDLWDNGANARQIITRCRDFKERVL